MADFIEIADTIRRQINHRQPLLMGCFGARDLVALNNESLIHGTDHPIRGGLMFRATAKRGAKVIIELTARDEYDVRVGVLRGVDFKVLATHEGVHWDQLDELIAADLGVEGCI